MIKCTWSVNMKWNYGVCALTRGPGVESMVNAGVQDVVSIVYGWHKQ